MVFSTPLFLFVYLSLTLLLYYAVPLKGRNLALLAVKPVLLCLGRADLCGHHGSFHR